MSATKPSKEPEELFAWSPTTSVSSNNEGQKKSAYDIDMDMEGVFTAEESGDDTKKVPSTAKLVTNIDDVLAEVEKLEKEAKKGATTINLPTGKVLASLVPKQAGLLLPRKHEHGVTESAQSLEPAGKVMRVTVEPSPTFKSTMLGSISGGGMRSTKKEKPLFISYVQFWLPKDGKNFVFVTIYNHLGEYGYQLPYKNLLRDYPQLAHDMLDMFGMVALRDPKYGDQEIPRFQENNPRYYKECLLVFFDGSISIDEFATKWCLTLSDFANQATNVHFRGDRNKFIYQENTFEQDKPVNYYLLTKETLLLLKKIYDPTGTRKSEIEKDTELLTKYFGDAKKGLTILKNLTEEHWVHLSN